MTSNHSNYSADRLDFVPAGELRVGETLRNLNGNVRIESIEQLGSQERVYNLEIDGEHVFRVASSGVLVHNSSGAEGSVNGVPVGTKLTRNWGGKSGPDGQSWTRFPVSKQTRESLGLGRPNTGEFVSHGELIDNAGVISRRALPWGGFKGGGDEVLVPDPATQI